MPVKVISTELGHAVPPEGPHTITVHLPGWGLAVRFRDRDMSIIPLLKSMYPRFSPFGIAMQFTMAVHKALALPAGYMAMPFTHPDTFQMAQDYAFSPHRKEDEHVAPDELLYRIVDVHGVRLYVLSFPQTASKAVVPVWANCGTGISTHLAEELLKYTDTITVVPFEASGKDDVAADRLPPATYLPEVDAHQKLRERIAGLLQRAAIDPATAIAAPGDVYLYSTGMAAIYWLHETLTKLRSGAAVALGSVFHSTFHVMEHAPGGFKHFGHCEAQGDAVDKLEAYLQDEAKEGRKVCYVFLEFPSNPILVTADLQRIWKLAGEYGFYVVVDDTVGGFCNVDVSAAADVVLSSLTKSFSGYADLMTGSIVLQPASPRYAALKALQQATYRNEYAAAAAECLLRNSENYMERSAVLNRNTAALAEMLQAEAEDPASPVTQVLYPPQSDTAANYRAYMRRPTSDFTPGYGCLLSVDFEDLEYTKIFYENLSFYHGPHLGAHVSLALPYNFGILGAQPETLPYHVSYGNRETQIRLSIGLEDQEEVIDTVRAALDKVMEEKKKKREAEAK